MSLIVKKIEYFAATLESEIQERRWDIE